jgi:hypothetical protein
MKIQIVRALCLMLFGATLASAQDVIPLYPGTPPGSEPANYPEKQYFSNIWKTEVVANVTKPTLTVFKPAPGTANGTAIVVAPGGGFMALSINTEGNDVAKYLAAKGVTAFVLKYRLAHTGEDATQEFTALTSNRQKFDETVGKVIPLGSPLLPTFGSTPLNGTSRPTVSASLASPLAAQSLQTLHFTTLPRAVPLLWHRFTRQQSE